MKAIFHVIKPPTFISVFCIQDLNTRIHVRPAAQLASAYSASPLNQLHFISSLDLSIIDLAPQETIMSAPVSKKLKFKGGEY